MRRSYAVKQLLRKHKRPAELLLVPMIDIFTVLVTFLLMTAVFSRTVILELQLSKSDSSYAEPPPGLQLEIIVRKDLLQIADRATGPLRTLPDNADGSHDLAGLTDYLRFVKSKYPEKTEATLLLEADTPYDDLIQLMDRTRVLEVNSGLSTVQAELFPNVSIGDAPALDAPAGGKT